MKRSQFIRQFALGLGSTIGLGACRARVNSKSGSVSPSSLPAPIPSDAVNPLKIATEPSFPPFSFRLEDGTLAGFEIDLMRAIAREAGFPITFQGLPFDRLIPALETRTVEMAISALTITQERLKQVAMSRPYFKSGLTIAVKTDNQTLYAPEDLRGKRVAVQTGSIAAKAVRQIAKVDVRSVDSIDQALQELMGGKVDAVLDSAPLLLYAIREQNLANLKIINDYWSEEFYGIAMPKDSPNLSVVNQAIEAIVSNGVYAQLYAEWFGSKPPALPELVSQPSSPVKTP